MSWLDQGPVSESGLNGRSDFICCDLREPDSVTRVT